MLETSTAEANLLGMSNPAVKPCQLLKISEGWFGGQSPPLICPSRKEFHHGLVVKPCLSKTRPPAEG